MAAWIVAVQWVSRLILVLLMGLSVWSVAIMLDRRKTFIRYSGSRTLAEKARELIQARNWAGLAEWAKSTEREQAGAVYAGTLKAALDTQSRDPDQIERSVKSYLVSERAKLEAGLTTLATLGSNAPFIGLFGTVLGIIQAFGALGTSASNGTASVMSSISEALVATAVGLFVAIPAVIAYNVFTRKLRVVLTECESLRDYYISRLEG